MHEKQRKMNEQKKREKEKGRIMKNQREKN